MTTTPDIYCAVLESNCEPHYFDSQEKAVSYIWSHYNTHELSEEESNLILHALRSLPSPDGFYEIPDFGYYSKIEIE